MEKRVGNGVVAAMTDAGVGAGELAEMIGLSGDLLAERLVAPSTFTVTELILIATVLGCDVGGFLPDADGFPMGSTNWVVAVVLLGPAANNRQSSDAPIPSGKRANITATESLWGSARPGDAI